MTAFLLVPQLQIKANEYQDADAIYFASRFCSSCQKLEQDRILIELVDQGYLIETIYVEDDNQNTK